MEYYVVRTYSNTTSRRLWKVESKPFSRPDLADAWCKFCQADWDDNNPRRLARFFVVSVPEGVKP